MEEVTCELQYSRAAEAFLALAVGATLAIVVFVPFPDAARALLFAWVVGGATLARHRLRAPRALRLDCDGGIGVREASGTREGKVVPGSFAAPWLTVVRWRPHGARFARALVLPPGAASPDALRKIRVLLRWA